MAASKHTKTAEAIQQEWVEVQAAQKNPALFRVLYTRYYESIFRFVYKRTGEESVAADVTSQAFLKAMQKLHKYTFQGVPFSAWLFRIASNEVAQYYRKTKKNRVVAIDDYSLEDVTEEMEDQHELTLQSSILQEVIQELKPDEVQLVELRFFEKRPFKEVADIMDMTENNAKVKVYRLLQKMRKKFEKKKPNG